MKDDAQASTSIWMATANTPSQARLKENIRTEVCIIGAGHRRANDRLPVGPRGSFRVVVLDDGLIGGWYVGPYHRPSYKRLRRSLR
jgi:hypothetical protein